MPDNHKKKNLTTEIYRFAYLSDIFNTNIKGDIIGKKFTVLSYPCCGQRCEALIEPDGYIILDDGSTVEPEWLFKQFRVEL